VISKKHCLDSVSRQDRFLLSTHFSLSLDRPPPSTKALSLALLLAKRFIKGLSFEIDSKDNSVKFSVTGFFTRLNHQAFQLIEALLSLFVRVVLASIIKHWKRL
jgi:hypothetical protein